MDILENDVLQTLSGLSQESVYLRVHLTAACAGQLKAAFQDIPVCSSWSCRPCRQPKAAFQCIQGLHFTFLPRMVGGRRPHFSVFKLAVGLFAVHDGRSRAAFQNMHVCLYFLSAHGGQPEAAFQQSKSAAYFPSANCRRPTAAFQ